MPDLHHAARAPIGPANIGSSRVTDALVAAVTLEDAAVIRLREAVCEYVRVQRGLETPPESIIARVKALANDSFRAGTPVEVRQALIQTTVEWCIATYYGDEHIDPSVDGAGPDHRDE